MHLLAGKLTGLSLCLTVAACIPTSTRTRPSIDRTVLTEEQFADRGYNNVYDVVAAVRSNWLNSRGPDSFTSPTRVQSYFDGSHLGAVETLRAMDVGRLARSSV